MKSNTSRISMCVINTYIFICSFMYDRSTSQAKRFLAFSVIYGRILVCKRNLLSCCVALCVCVCVCVYVYVCVYVCVLVFEEGEVYEDGKL